MRVGLNLTWLTGAAGGVGRYAVELTRALASDPGIDLRVYAAAGTERLDVDASWKVVPRAGPGRAGLLAEYGVLPLLAVRDRVDVLHSPANAGPVLVPGVPSVITMHDLIWLHEGADWGPPEAIAAMRRVGVPTGRRATRVLADSEHAAEDLVAELGFRRERIDVAPLGVAPAPAGDAPAIDFGLGDGPMLLCVAQKRRYKHQLALVDAVNAHPDPTLRLVLPGAPTAYEAELRARADDRTVFLGYVSDDELEALYARATAFVLPSRREGFGLPILEAMARGVPVACSNRASLPEVAGDAALLFDPDDQTAVNAAVSQLLDDAALRQRLSAAGRARAAQFTWTRTAELTVESYRRAAHRSRSLKTR